MEGPKTEGPQIPKTRFYNTFYNPEGGTIHLLAMKERGLFPPTAGTSRIRAIDLGRLRLRRAEADLIYYSVTSI